MKAEVQQNRMGRRGGSLGEPSALIGNLGGTRGFGALARPWSSQVTGASSAARADR